MRTDVELVEAARHGDRSAMGRLLERHQETVYRFGRRMCRDKEDAEDVRQEALLAAARTVPGYRGDASLSTWLYVITRSFCIKRRRRSRFAPESMESLDALRCQENERALCDPGRTPDEALEFRRMEVALAEAIRALEPNHRDVLMLRDIEGLSTAEVAEVLGLSAEAVKSRLHRARLAVRRRVAPLQPVGESDSADHPG